MLAGLVLVATNAPVWANGFSWEQVEPSSYENSDIDLVVLDPMIVYGDPDVIVLDPMTVWATRIYTGIDYYPGFYTPYSYNWGNPAPQNYGCSAVYSDADGANPFRAVDGNAIRKVKELVVPGSVGRGLAWERFNNSRPRHGDGNIFGRAGDWRHSWQFTLREVSKPGLDRPQLNLTYPSGFRRDFRPVSGGGWAADAGFEETIAVVSDGYDVTTPGLAHLHFVRKTDATGHARYEMQAHTDAYGVTTTLDYDAQGFLSKVTDASGRFLQLTYRDIPLRRTERVALGTMTADENWQEIAVPAALQTVALQSVRLRQPDGAAAGLAEIQLFAPGATTPLPGTPKGSNPSATAAFDGDAATAFVPKAGMVNWCELSFGVKHLSPVARIRVLPVAGQGAALGGATIEGLYSVTESVRTLAQVQASDGQTVSYDYETDSATKVDGQKLPSTKAALIGARYGDGTAAHYKYDVSTVGTRPLLREADDPRFDGRAKHIRYTYQQGKFKDHGIIHEEINPTTHSVYASLEIDPVDPSRRTVVYSDLRQVSYKLSSADDEARVLSRTDSLGRTTRLTYDSARRPATATDHAGRVTTYAYDEKSHLKGADKTAQGRTRHERQLPRDAKGRIGKKTDRDGRETTYDRDSHGRISRIHHPDGTTREFTYDDLGRVTSARGRDGGLVQFGYNERGMCSSRTDPLGRVTRYTYDSRDRVAAMTDALGNTTTFERNDRNQPTKVSKPDGTALKFAYDAYGNRTAETDEQGRTTTHSYDELGRMTKTVDAAGRTTSYDYAELPGSCGCSNVADHPTRIVQPDGSVVAMLYDGEGRLISRTEAVDTPAAATTLYAYDADNNLLSTTDPLGRITRYTYDDEGHRLSATDPLGHVTQWTYDDRGNVLTVTTPDGGVTKSVYDANDRLVKKTDAAGNPTKFAYDDVGNVVLVTAANGEKTSYTYDHNRRTAATYADSKQETWTYDALGLVTSATSVDGVFTTTTYDAVGRPTRVQRAVPGAPAESTVYTYDAFGRRSSTADPLGRVTRWTYDLRGNILTVTRPDGSATTNTYDTQNHLLTTTDAAGGTTAYTYDAAGNQTSLTDANGHIYRFGFDARHRKTSMTYPDNSQESWTYDLAGNPIASTTRAGQIKTTTYNAANQPLRETWSNPSPLPASPLPALPADTTYAYDQAGRLQRADNGNARLSYDYDESGRIAAETSDLSALVAGLDRQTVKYRYDELGRLARLVYPDQTKVSYVYDVRSRLTTIDNNGGGSTPLATYAYDGLGRVAKLTRDNGVVSTYSYDVAGQLTDIAHTKGSDILASSHYVLDALGRRTSQTREDGITENYTYDATGQLTGVDYGNATKETFAYDPVGNRTQVGRVAPDVPPATTSYTTNLLNQYTAVAALPLTYDSNGNLTGDGKQVYGYDAQNRLVTVETQSGVVVDGGSIRAEFFYDARNRCVLRKYYRPDNQGRWVINNADSRALTYDLSWNLLAERKLDGGAMGSYVHGIRSDETLLATLKLQSAYSLADGLGCAVALTNARGTVTDRFRYSAFGKQKTLEPNYRLTNRTSNYRFLFTGREWLPCVALNDHRNRYFSPSVGRWLSTDPIRFKAYVNLYSYGLQNPVGNVDLDGNCAKPYWDRYKNCLTDMTGLNLTATGAEILALARFMKEYSQYNVEEIFGVLAARGADAASAASGGAIGASELAGVSAVALEVATVAGATFGSYFVGAALGCVVGAMFY